MGYRVGVDIGGSFTDFALFDESTKSLKSLKVFSRPDQPGEEVIAGIRAVQERYGISPGDIAYFTHGTTVGINTVIQRKGLKLALFTTANFCDVLEIARLKIPDMYNLLSKRPAPLITRDMVFGIPGRVDFEGNVVAALDEEAVAEATRAAVARGAEGIVIGFLHSYRNSAHELAAKAVVAATAPGLPVFTTSEVWPIIREYERTITSVIGAYVQPRVSNYLTQLQRALKDLGVAPEPHLTKSNGGVMTAEQGKEGCVQMILSGTASGVIGAAYVAKVAGLQKCMSLDIGGTSADVAIIVDGKPEYGVGEKIGDFQIYIPSVSVTSVGEGGGSIAWVDAQHVLRVGPESAGSNPGPACYGRGGQRATITDAFAAIGLIGEADLGYNAVTIDRWKARSVVAELAAQIDRGVDETAEAIISIAVSSMYSDVSGLVSRFGIDPREFSCLAFGGAGPMLASFLARELGMQEVVVPLTPGVLSALGGLIADLKNDFIRTLYTDLTVEAVPGIATAFEELKLAANDWLRNKQNYDGPCELDYSAEMRYRGQSFEVETPLDPAALARNDVAVIAEAFHREHQRIYGHADRKAEIQLISIRLVISGKTVKPEFTSSALVEIPATPVSTFEAYIDGRTRTVELYQRADLMPGHTFAGPAVVAQEDCTTVLPPGVSGRVDAFGNLRLATGSDR